MYKLPSDMNHHIHPGFKLQGTSYTIEDQLGTGGFGITYKGKYQKEISIEERFQNISSKVILPVAIKELFIEGKCVRNGEDNSVLLQSLSAENFTNFKQKFLQEAKILAGFNKVPHIVHVIDFFEENNTAYIVMEYVEGKTLSEIIKANGKLDESRTFKYMEQISRGLQVVHKEQIIHRDIKPDNIIITPKDQAILIDFGAAREFVTNQSITNSVILTHGFAPIEQYSEKRVRGPFTDVYALGATMVYCLTGKRPLSVHDREPDQLAITGEDISDKAKRIINKSMAYRATDRYQDCGQLLADLTNSTQTAEDQTIVHTGNEIKTVSHGTLDTDTSNDADDSNQTIMIESEEHEKPSFKSKYIFTIAAAIIFVVALIVFWGKYQVNRLLKSAEQNYTENKIEAAFADYEEASEKGSSLGDYFLSKLYYQGWGVERDPQKGRFYAERALDEGYDLAAYNLGLAYLYGWGVEMDTTQSIKYFDHAIPAIQEKSETGDAEAQFLLGNIYRWGYGRSRNDYEAFNWFKKSAEQGHLTAQTRLASMFYYGDGTEQDYERSLEWFQKGEQFQNSGSLDGLGLHHYYGNELDQDYEKAFEYFKNAAHSENASANSMKNLGVFYQYGADSIKPDKQQAFEWYQKASNLGSHDAMWRLGTMYANGEVVEKNPETAGEWYLKSAILGNKEAMYKMGLIYATGGKPEEYAMAVDWFKKSSDAGNAKATRELGWMYYNEKYGMLDYNKAAKYYSEAANANNASAMNDLGVCYENGRGVPKDPKLAFEWYTKAAQAGNKYAMYNLGLIYHYGKDRNKDLTLANYWYTRAKNAGHTGAATKLKALKNTKQQANTRKQVTTRNTSTAGSTYTVASRKQTNYYLKAGDKFTISASGTISFGAFAGSGGPNGITGFSTYSVAPSYNHGALLLTIGNSDGLVYVGYGNTFEAKTSGYLTLIVNDKDTSNNRGSFTVTVKPSN
jgi:TPR repeat protein/predicted Ser/Thr protein kinase